MANKKLTFKFDNNLLTAIVYIVIGILCCIFQAKMLEVLFTICGALLIVQGVLSLIEKDWVNAAINIVIGILIIVFAWAVVEVILIIVGVLIVLKGVKQLLDALKTKDMVAIIAAAVTILVGILLIVAKWVASWIFIVIGIIFIINGVMLFFGKKN